MPEPGAGMAFPEVLIRRAGPEPLGLPGHKFYRERRCLSLQAPLPPYSPHPQMGGGRHRPSRRPGKPETAGAVQPCLGDARAPGLLPPGAHGSRSRTVSQNMTSTRAWPCSWSKGQGALQPGSCASAQGFIVSIHHGERFLGSPHRRLGCPTLRVSEQSRPPPRR